MTFRFEPSAYCPLVAVAMRKEPSHRAEMVNQLLFGDGMWIVDRHDDWVKVKLFLDTYEGWVSYNQIVETEEVHEHNAIAKKETRIIYDGEAMTIQPGSYYNTKWLPEPMENNQEEFFENDPATVATRFLGTPYLWGGRTLTGIDCSGLTQVVFKICGRLLMRDAAWQARQGDEVSFNDKKAGDLAFFEDDKQNIVHVGIILDDSKIIHASGKVRIDRLDTTGILVENKGIYTHHLCGIRRMEQ